MLGGCLRRLPLSDGRAIPSLRLLGGGSGLRRHWLRDREFLLCLVVLYLVLYLVLYQYLLP